MSEFNRDLNNAIATYVNAQAHMSGGDIHSMMDGLQALWNYIDAQKKRSPELFCDYWECDQRLYRQLTIALPSKLSPLGTGMFGVRVRVNHGVAPNKFECVNYGRDGSRTVVKVIEITDANKP